jgi:hypothetical protein
MPHPQLDNLVRIGQLKAESPVESEISGLRRSGLSRLADAERAELLIWKAASIWLTTPRKETEKARRQAKARGLDQAAIDEAIRKCRCGR